jgi:para-aminobenzoate synthetase component I
MWSDRTPPERLRALVAELHSVLPPPGLHNTGRIDQGADSSHPQPGFASVTGTTPLLLSNPLATITYTSGSAVIAGPRGTVEISASAFDVLDAMLAAWHGPSEAILAGFLSYDLATEIEDLGRPPKQDFSFPTFYFALYDSALRREDDRWVQVTTDAWRTPPLTSASRIPERPLRSGPLRSRPDRASFEASVERIVATIRAGDIFQTNLCRRLEADLDPAAAWDLYQRMRTISPAQYESYIQLDAQHAILSISPELFLKVDAGIVESSPIKGTRPRAHDAAQDQALSAELLASEKDRAELAMIVDVVRNDLGRVCETGSVEVTQHAALMSLPTVHHLYSTVRGRLREGLVDLLRAAFPAASITGAPKIEAIRAAMREEGQMRGPCMGAIGWISMDGNMELSVAIRTAFTSDGQVRYYAGCGITADSDPHTEFLESSHKAAAFVRALDKREVTR